MVSSIVSAEERQQKECSHHLLNRIAGILVTSDLPVTIHVAPVDTYRGYTANTPDAYLARPFSDSSSSTQYFIAGYHDMTTRTAPM